MFGIFGRTAAKKESAKQYLVEQYHAQFGPYLAAGDMEKGIRENSYIAGYFFGKQTNLLAYLIKTGEVAPGQRDEMTFLLFQALFGSEQRAKSILLAIKTHFEDNNADFSEGTDKAGRVVAFAVGVLPYRSDPDYENALQALKRKESAHGSKIAPDDHTAAILGFEQLWIGDHLERFVFGHKDRGFE